MQLTHQEDVYPQAEECYTLANPINFQSCSMLVSYCVHHP